MKLFKQLSWQKTAQKSEQGFTLLEVLVAIVIITAFVNVSLLGLVTTALLKSKAKDYSNGITLIKRDLEEVRDKAANLLSYNLSANAAAAQRVVTLTSVGGLANNDQIKIGTDNTTYTIQSISGNSLTLTANLATAQSANVPVTAIPVVNRCTAASSTCTGFADYLRQNLPVLSFPANINGKDYFINRSSTIASSDISPPRFEVLRLSYNVRIKNNDGTEGREVASIYAEVVPSAFYKC